MNQITDDYPFVFVDPKSVELFELACKVARTEIPVLVRGPSGTGKEVLARVLHESSAASDQPFVALNCAAIPRTPSRRHAVRSRKRRFHRRASVIRWDSLSRPRAVRSFWMRLARCHSSCKQNFLRVLQEKQIYRVGATTPVSVDVRIIAATNVDLKYNIQNRLIPRRSLLSA